MSSGVRSLWLPLHHRAMAWGCAGLVLAFHVATMARDLTAYDSPELALAAHQLGLGHPPGQPLHTLLGFLFAHLPGVPPLVGLTLLSALPAALTVLPVMSLAEGLAPHGRVLLRAAVIALLSIHPALWETASRVEIYALATFLGLWSSARLAAALSAGDAGEQGREASGARAKGWFATGLGLGLAAAVNPVIATFVPIAALPALLARRPPIRQLGLAVLGGALGLVPYLYIPLIARRDPSVFVWGAPQGGNALKRYLTVADFAGNAGKPIGTMPEHLGDFALWSMRHGLLPVVALGVVAWTWLARRERSSGLGLGFAPIHLGLALLFITSNTVFLADNPDYLGYLAAPLFVLVAALAAGVSRLAASGRVAARVGAGVVAFALVVAALFAPPAAFARTRSRDRVARIVNQSALESAPPGAFLVVSSDHWVFPMAWLQEAEARRPDVVVLAMGLASSSWYWEHLFRRHPDLVRIELLGPGGSAGRVRRLLDAHASRPVLVERIGLAAELRVRVCPGAWLLEVAEQCPETEPDQAPVAVLERALAEVGRGSPASDALLTQVAFDRGEGLWRLGYGRAALAFFLAGVPASARPEPTRLDAESLDRVPPLRGSLPVWTRPTALGDPARNLLLASALLHAAGDEAAALRHAGAAENRGLAEARPGQFNKPEQ